MGDSRLRRLFIHASHYSLANLLAMVAGLVSFPLLTRIFSVADFGLMGLISVTMTLSVALGKFGAQHAVLRYHSEIAAGKRPYTLQQLAGTVLLGMSSTGAVIALLLLVAARLAPASLVSEPRLRALLTIACIPIVARVVESSLVNFIRAEQRTKLVVVYDVSKRYLGLGLTLLALFVVARSLTSFYVAMAITEALAVVLLAVAVFRSRGRSRPSTRDFSAPLFKELLSFGIPMMIGFELSGIVLAVGDRYAINWLLGPEQLGLYAAAYTICDYVQQVVISSVNQAVMPIYMQMWDTRGREETAAFIDRSLRSYAMLGVPVVVGVAVVGPELLPTLASDKFASASGVLPWVIAGMVVDGCSSQTGAGLFIHKRTRQIISIAMSCAAVNIVLNLVLVPRLGITGAAVATLVSYSMSAVLFAVVGRHLLTVRIPWRTILRAGAASAVMYLAVAFIMPGQRLLTVAVRASLGACVYAVLIVLIDPDARNVARQALARFGWVRSAEPSGEV